MFRRRQERRILSPACGHKHEWTLYPDLEPGSKFAQAIDQAKEKFEITPGGVRAFIAAQMCENCETNLSTVVNPQRAEAPVIPVHEMYGVEKPK